MALLPCRFRSKLKPLAGGRHGIMRYADWAIWIFRARTKKLKIKQMRSSKPAVVILNMSYTGVAIARNLRHQHVPILGVTAKRDIFGNHTRCAEVLFAPDSAEAPEELASFLVQLAKRFSSRPVLFATRDQDVSFIEHFRQVLERFYLLPIPAPGVLNRLLDKWETASAAIDLLKRTTSASSKGARKESPGTQRQFQDHRQEKQGAGRVRRPMIDLACGCAKPEVRAEAVPKIQAEGKRGRTKQPEGPNRASVPQHVARIANLAERSDADVGPVGNQAEAREELKHVGPLESADPRSQEKPDWQDDANDWPRPDDQQRTGIWRNIRPGNRQRVKDDSFNPPARGNGTDDMPEFVDGHHRQPAQRQECADQQNLVEAFHKINSPTTSGQPIGLNASAIRPGSSRIDPESFKTAS